jgi:hypothetical protein
MTPWIPEHIWSLVSIMGSDTIPPPIPPMMMTRTKKTKGTRAGTKNRRSSENSDE